MLLPTELQVRAPGLQAAKQVPPAEQGQTVLLLLLLLVCLQPGAAQRTCERDKRKRVSATTQTSQIASGSQHRGNAAATLQAVGHVAVGRPRYLLVCRRWHWWHISDDDRQGLSWWVLPKHCASEGIECHTAQQPPFTLRVGPPEATLLLLLLLLLLAICLWAQSLLTQWHDALKLHSHCTDGVLG
jgi:hypothetical protein